MAVCDDRDVVKKVVGYEDCAIARPMLIKVGNTGDVSSRIESLAVPLFGLKFVRYADDIYGSQEIAYAVEQKAISKLEESSIASQIPGQTEYFFAAETDLVEIASMVMKCRRA